MADCATHQHKTRPQSAKLTCRRNTPITRLSSIRRIIDRRLTHGRHAQWLGQSRTSFSHVLSQNETWWSPAWFPLNSNDDPLSSLLLVVVCTRCVTQDYYAQVGRLDLHERCECMLNSVVQMYVGHQMLSTAGMELCNHQKFRILAQN